MPFLMPDEVKKYTWKLSGGLPVGECIHLGGIVYCVVCPLCGFIHEIRGATLDISGGEYQPTCIAKVTHKHSVAAWVEKFPLSIEYSRVWLIQRQPVTVPMITPLLPTRRGKQPLITAKAA